MNVDGTRKLALLLFGSAVAIVAVAATAPLTVILGASRLVVSAVLATGAWVSIRRLGSVDLGTGAAALAGAAVGGVVPALLDVPVAVGVLPAALAGAAVTGTVVAVGARVGRAPSALTSLAVAIAGVAAASSWNAAGGRAGFHAVPLITGSDRGDLVVGFGVLAVALVAVGAWTSRRSAASAAVSVRAAHVAAALGHRPVLAAARGGVVAGAVLGIGGWLQATATGSVIPGGYGLALSASLALAALVGGGSVLSGPAGALVVFGPAVIWPTAPVVGEASVLVVGVLGLALLAVRPGGLLRPSRGDPAALDAPDAPRADDVPASARRSDVLSPDAPTTLAVGETSLPAGPVSLRVEPGEVVAVVGPNGSGKSTLLARIAGQLPDGGVVRFGARPAPAGAVARARRGLARTWQHPPDVGAEDGLLAAVRDAEDRDAAQHALDLLGDHAATPAGRDLVRLAARRPAVAILDEPGATLPTEVVAPVLRALAEAGAAVLIAEHRRELAALADRTVELGRHTRGPAQRQVALPAVAPGGAPLSVEAAGQRLTVLPGDVHVLQGAGAQRIVQAVLGVPGADGAEVEIGDRRVRGADLASRVRQGLGIVTDAPPPADVSVRDHLAAIGGVGEADRLLSGAPLLAGRGGDPTGVLSGGERRVLSWLVCLAVRPDAVVLDRATAGLDPDGQAWAAGVVAAWRDAGVPVLVRAGRPEERGWAGEPGLPYG